MKTQKSLTTRILPKTLKKKLLSNSRQAQACQGGMIYLMRQNGGNGDRVGGTKYKKPSAKDILRWVLLKDRPLLQRAEGYAMLMLLASVPLSYLHKLVPPEKEFLFFQEGYYTDFNKFIAHSTHWFILAILSTQYYFLCRKRWLPCLGALVLNYWWVVLCSLAWGIGILQKGEQLYMLPPAMAVFYWIHQRRARWGKLAYKEDKDNKKRDAGWTVKDYTVGALLLLCASLTHVYLLFPQTPDFYFFHSGWFHSVQVFVYFLGQSLGAALWMLIWFFDRHNRSLYVYIAWPSLMFTFKLVGMITIEFGITTEVSQGYYYVLPPTILATYILYRIRKSLYIRTHRKDTKRMMPLRACSRLFDRTSQSHNLGIKKDLYEKSIPPTISAENNLK